MPITTLLAEVDFEGTRLHRLLKKSGKQIPRGLKPARDDKNKELSGTAEAVPFQGIAQKNTAHRDNSYFTTRALMSLLLIAVTAMLVSCSNKPKETEPVVMVQTAVAQRGTIQQVIGAEAILFPRDQAAITPKVVAPVRTFYVNRGSRVQRGQVLAVLENRDLAAAEVENKGTYEQAQAAYGLETSSALPEEWQKAELDLKTAKESYDAQQKVYDSRRVLFQQGALPRKQLDESAVALIQAKAQYEMAEKHLSALQSAGKQQQMKAAQGQLTSAKGKYEGAAAQLAYTEIRSPIDGVVTDRPGYPGETPAAGVPLLTIMDTSSVTARAHIPQSDAAGLKPGDAATITAPGEAAVKGKVTLVSPALDPNSTTVEVWIGAVNPDGRLRPGTTVNVQMIAQTLNDAIVVPVSALLKTPDGQTTVMIVKDDRAHQVSVETGIRQGDRVQITKGLSGGEAVIMTGAYGLPDNTKVKVAEPATPAPAENSGSKKGDAKD
jgi:HlyD family secretion protein